MKTLILAVSSVVLLNIISLVPSAHAQYCNPRREICQPLRVGANVIDENNYEGTIAEIFEGASANVAYPQYDEWGRVYKTDYHIKAMRNLVQAVSRLERYAERAEVIDENNYQGYIFLLYADGRTRVAYPQYDEFHRPFKTDYHLKSVRNLSLGVQQVRGLIVGDNVIDDNNFRGAIDKLYADGRAQVAYPQYSNGGYYKTDYHLKNVLQLRKIYSVER